MSKERYFECRNCHQVVQGWHAAMEWVDCCDNKDMVEIDGPEEVEGPTGQDNPRWDEIGSAEGFPTDDPATGKVLVYNGKGYSEISPEQLAAILNYQAGYEAGFKDGFEQARA